MKEIWRITRRKAGKSIEQTNTSGTYKSKYDFTRSQYIQQQRSALRETGEKIPASDSDRPPPTDRIFDLKTFANDAWVCPRKYYPHTSLEPQSISGAYNLYLKGRRRGNLDLIVLGRLPSGQKGEDGTIIPLPSNEAFPSIDKAMRENLLNADEDLTTGDGSIIKAKNWTLLANDGWTLGGNHAKTEFHFGSRLEWNNLWNQRDKRMTVMAREILSITANGYEIWKPHREFESVAVCVDENQASNATLLGYSQAVLKHWKPEELEKFFYSLPKEVRE